MANNNYNFTISLQTIGESEFAKLAQTFNAITQKANVLNGHISKISQTAAQTQSTLSKGFDIGDIGNISPDMPFEKNINNAISRIKSKVQDITGFDLKTDNAKQSIESLRTKIAELQSTKSVSLNTAQIGKANTEIKKLESEIKKLENQPPDGIFQRFSNLRSSISPLGGMIAGIFAVGSIVSFGSDVVKVTADFQKYNAVLANTFGSGQMAATAMQDLQKLASTTPFALNSLTESYVKLVNRGFTPTMQEMTKLGDLASSTGKDFDQLTEAVLDAETGEFERLKEFGIKAKKEGDKVSVTFKGQTKQIGNNAKEIRGYLLGLGDMKGVKGSMASISGTVGGQLSNLGDTFDMFKLKIGQAFAPIINLGIMVTNKLISMGAALMDKVMPYVSEFTTFITQNMPFVKDILKGVAIAVGLVTSGFLLLNITILANPIVWLGALLVGLIGYFGYLYASSETFRGALWGLYESGKVVFLGLWNIVKSVVSNMILALQGLGNILMGVFTLDWTQIKEGFGQTASGILNLGKDLAGETAKILGGTGAAFTEGMKGGKADFQKSQTENKAYKQTAIENQITADQKKNAEQSEIDKATAQGLSLADLANFKNSGAESKGMSIADFMSNNGASAGEGSANGNAKGKGTKSGLGSGISEIKSDSSAARNLTINIEKLVEVLNINTQNLQEGAGRIKEEITKVLLSATNDVNLAV